MGEDTGTPVDLSYDVPFKFTGTIDKVVIDLKPMEAKTASMSDQKQREANAAIGLQN